VFSGAGFAPGDDGYSSALVRSFEFLTCPQINHPIIFDPKAFVFSSTEWYVIEIYQEGSKIRSLNEIKI
jgi:hypothetical protein